MKVIVFTYNRETMLRQVVKQLEAEGMDYHVIDDGSDYDLSQFIPRSRFTRFKNGGKRKFWMKFFHAFEICKASDHDDFLFTADDFLDLQLDTLKQIAAEWSTSEYVVNIINDGRESSWGEYKMGLKPIPLEPNNLLREVGFCDCGFLTNRLSIQDITIEPTPESWFDRPEKSSGVGMQLTTKFRINGIPMLKPQSSLAFHGDHESRMHKEHRANQIKLISK